MSSYGSRPSFGTTSTAPQDVMAACEKSLTDLRVDYLDAYLVHWPFPNHHDAGVDVRLARPTLGRTSTRSSWPRGARWSDWLTKGLSAISARPTLTVPKLRLLLADARIRPAVNEMELHPHFQQPELFSYVRQRYPTYRVLPHRVPRAAR